METLLHDLRFALRQLTKSPGMALLAVFTLALGIGANTAIFTVIENVLLRPLPYPDAQRMLFVGPAESPHGFGQCHFAGNQAPPNLPLTVREHADNTENVATAIFQHLRGWLQRQPDALVAARFDPRGSGIGDWPCSGAHHGAADAKLSLPGQADRS